MGQPAQCVHPERHRQDTTARRESLRHDAGGGVMSAHAPVTEAPELFPAVRRTPLPGGYMGKLLRVDLSAGRCWDVNLPEEPLLRKLWGGQALATYILLHMLPPDAQPLGPEN